MCGIMGFCGGSVAALHTVEGLRCLDYRGYDSAGVAAISDGSLVVRKDVGCIEEVNLLHGLAALEGSVAIGHTRWATHGAVTQENAHPHTDSVGRVAVVHNGIIENYEELRNELRSKGVSFRSETDTEVIPQLLGRELRNGADCLENAVRAVCPRLHGSYAFAAMCVDDRNKIVGVRHGNALVVGYGEEGFCLCSDALAFGSCANCMAPLHDGELAILTPDGVCFVDSEGRPLQKDVMDVDCSWADTGLDGQPHHMLKEILEQPQALLRTIRQDDSFVREVVLDILRARQVVITACGTSRHASLVGRYLFSKVAGKFCDVVMASEFGYFADSVDKHTLVIAVSQSGETADVLEGVRLAKEAGARVVSIVNRPTCQLADESDHVIRLNCGAEIGVAATKSFVSQLAVFYLFAFAMANRLEEGRADVEAASGQLSELLWTTNHSLEELAFRLKDSEHFYYIGRGTNFATAMEGALKMKEISYIHAEGMPAGELKHGTLALIEKGTPVLAICPDDDTYLDTRGNVMEAKARGARIIGVSDRESGAYDDWIRIPAVPPLLYPLMSVVPLQLLAYHMAVIRGCDPDKPRNLAKSVTVK